MDLLAIYDVMQEAEIVANQQLRAVAADLLRSWLLTQYGLAANLTPDDVWAQQGPEAIDKAMKLFGGV